MSVMWGAGYSTDNILPLLSIKSLSIGIVLFCLWSVSCFWLRSYNKTGVGCDNCTWPPSQTEHLTNLPQTLVLREEYCSIVKHYENVG